MSYYAWHFKERHPKQLFQRLLSCDNVKQHGFPGSAVIVAVSQYESSVDQQHTESNMRPCDDHDIRTRSARPVLLAGDTLHYGTLAAVPTLCVPSRFVHNLKVFNAIKSRGVLLCQEQNVHWGIAYEVVRVPQGLGGLESTHPCGLRFFMKIVICGVTESITRCKQPAREHQRNGNAC